MVAGTALVQLQCEAVTLPAEASFLARMVIRLAVRSEDDTDMQFSASAVPQSLRELAAYVAGTALVMVGVLCVGLERHTRWFLWIWSAEAAVMVGFVVWRASVIVRRPHATEAGRADRVVSGVIRIGLYACAAAVVIEHFGRHRR